MSKPYSKLKQLGWRSGQCNTIIKETGFCCQEPATYEVRNLVGKIVGRCCPKHGKEFELLIQGANAYVSALVGKN